MSVEGEDEIKGIYIEQTLAIIKPDAYERAEEIEDIIRNEGFTIVQRKEMELTPDQAEMFYEEHAGKDFFDSLVKFMTSGPIIVLVLAKEDAVSHWRQVIGPTSVDEAKEYQPESIRALYGENNQRNAVHGSDSIVSAEREIHFFFPESIIEHTVTPSAAHEYLAKTVNPVLLKGLILLCKQRPENPVLWLADWLSENNPNSPQMEK